MKYSLHRPQSITKFSTVVQLCALYIGAFVLFCVLAFCTEPTDAGPTLGSLSRNNVTRSSGRMPPTSSQTRGLRSSCDKCHQTKLKCVPGLTGCQRCANLDLRCVYSPPGRSGRVPAAERRAKGDSKAITPPRNQSPSDNEMVQDSARSSSDHPETGKKWRTTPSNSVQVDPMIEGMDFISGTDSNILLGSFDAGDMIDLSMPSPFDMLSPTTAVIDFAMATDSISGKAPELDFTGHLPTMNMPTSQCGCFQSIITALQNIQNPAVRSFSLDAMLSCNKEALVAICDSLKCSSSHDGTTRLVTLVVVQRALYLYRILYQSRLQERHNNIYHDPDSPYTASSSLSSGSSCPTSLTGQNTDCFSFAPHDGTNVLSASDASKGRLSLGTYKLDSADEDSLTKQLLILDLNKIPRLLERLDRRAYGPDESDGLDLYNILRSTLVTDFRSLVMEATSHR